ncbi:hypothetical protein [Nonomuraea sp. NPDC049695]|uniref:hypothetical protein n=1 Tax=Nonomuraea sp. NPDC049695 TaxID=3154734 RepID=UPI00343A411D
MILIKGRRWHDCKRARKQQEPHPTGRDTVDLYFSKRLGVALIGAPKNVETPQDIGTPALATPRRATDSARPQQDNQPKAQNGSQL